MAVDGTPAPAPTEKALVESPSRRRTIGWYSALASVDPVDRTIGAGNAVTAHRVNDTAAIKPSNVVRELIATILKVKAPKVMLSRETMRGVKRMGTRLYSYQVLVPGGEPGVLEAKFWGAIVDVLGGQARSITFLPCYARGLFPHGDPWFQVLYHATARMTLNVTRYPLV